MPTPDMMEALQALAAETGMSTEVLLEAVANGLESAYKRTPDAADDAYVFIDETFNISVIAQEIDEEGNVIQEWDDTPENFGRIAAQTARQVLTQRIREVARAMNYEEYAGREGAIVTGSSSAIGLAIALALAESGVQVMITGREPENVKKPMDL